MADAIEVFLSSKQSEFEIERALIVERIKAYSMLEPVNAEDWAPQSAPVRELMLEKVQRSMIYVGLFGAIYSEATELEYRAALSNPYRERMLYLKNMPDDHRASEVRRLIGDLHAQNTVARFTDVRDLLPHFTAHLSDALVRIALKLRKLGEPPPVPKSHRRKDADGHEIGSGLVRRWAAEQKQLRQFGFEKSTPEEIAALIKRIEAERPDL
jgi:hypothetical protein